MERSAQRITSELPTIRSECGVYSLAAWGPNRKSAPLEEIFHATILSRHRTWGAIAILATAGLAQKDEPQVLTKLSRLRKWEARVASTIFLPTSRIAFWLCRGAAPWAE